MHYKYSNGQIKKGVRCIGILSRVLMPALWLYLFSSSVQLWANFDLIDSETGALVNGLNNAETSINLNTIKKRAFNLKYSTSNASVQVLEFYINGVRVQTDESSSPFYLYANDEAWLPAPGAYALEVKGYDSSNTLVLSDSLTLNITDTLSHRMRKVFLSTGSSNQEIRVSMKRHAFIFGSQTVEEGSLNPTDTKPYPVRISGNGANASQMAYINKYREVFLENFNYSVAGNAMKWYSMGTNGTSFSRADRWYNWHTSNDIPVRGHTLLWGKKSSTNLADENMHDPQWIEDLMEGTEAEKEQAKLAIKNRIQQVVSHYAGKIDEWDFNNELWNYDHYRRQFDGQSNFRTGSHSPAGASILAEFAEVAKTANPNIKLYHNDYNIITQSGTGNATSFKNLLIDLRENHGVPVDGIGVQGHFGNTARSQAHITNCLNILDDVGVPIKITELDIGAIGSSEAAKANQLENVFRAAFEHAAVEGIIFWGFWSGCHWRDYRAPWQYEGYDKYDTADTSDDVPSEWVATDQVTRYRSLVFDEWWTDSVVETDANGNVELSVFAGDYDILIDGATFTQSIPIESEEETYYLEYNNGELYETAGSFGLIRPVEGSQFYPQQTIDLEAAYPDGSNQGIEYVEFYADGQLLKRDSVAPFRAKFYDASEGFHTLSIQAESSSLIEDSVEIHVGINNNLGANLIPEASFEQSVDSAFAPFTSSQVFLTRNTVQSRSGIYSMYVQRDFSPSAASWNGILYYLSGANATVELEVGQTYRYSAWVRLEENSQNLSLTIKKSTDPASYQTLLTMPNGVSAGEWIEVSGEFVYDASMEFIYIAGVDTAENFYVDDVLLAPFTEPINPEDTDQDGLLDAWEISYFNSIDADPNADSDADGLSNLFEFRSGTHPLNAYSKFIFNSFVRGVTNNDLSWFGSDAQAYRILSKSDLTSPNWTVVDEAVSGSFGGVNYWSETHNGVPAKFYKIEIDD